MVPDAPPPQMTVHLYGPIDVVGIDPRHVIRTEPWDATPGFEPNYLAGIEFDHPDFPWLFTPVKENGDRLRPWVALIALADGEYDEAKEPPGPLPVISVNVPAIAKLPDLADSWAWAHAQVAGGVGADTLDQILEVDPGRATSRLLCPRRLDPRPTTRPSSFPPSSTGAWPASARKSPWPPAPPPTWPGMATRPRRSNCPCITASHSGPASRATSSPWSASSCHANWRRRSGSGTWTWTSPAGDSQAPAGRSASAARCGSVSSQDTNWSGQQRETFRRRAGGLAINDGDDHAGGGSQGRAAALRALARGALASQHDPAWLGSSAQSRPAQPGDCRLRLAGGARPAART